MPGLFAASSLEPPTMAGSSFAGLGFPTLTIKTTAAGLVAPVAVEAGRYLVTLAGAGVRHGEVQFVLPPAGVAAFDVAAVLAGAAVLPDWFYRVIWNGGPAAAPDSRSTAQAIVDLTPGDWLIVPPDGDPTISPATLTVTGSAPTKGAVPRADLSVTMYEHGFDLPEVVPAGPRVWAVTNAGEVPHEIVLLGYPRPVTLMQVVTALLPEDGDVAAGPAIDSDLLAYAGYVPLLSPGVSTWVAMDLAPGSYVALSGIARAGSATTVTLGKLFTVVRGTGGGWSGR